MKASIISKPVATLLQTDDAVEKDKFSPASEQGKQLIVSPVPGVQRIAQPNAVVSSTEATKLSSTQHNPDWAERDETEPIPFVLPGKIANGALPPAPKLDSSSTSFTCPYCSLHCPAREVCWLLVVTGMDPHSSRMYLCTYFYLYKDKRFPSCRK